MANFGYHGSARFDALALSMVVAMATAGCEEVDSKPTWNEGTMTSGNTGTGGAFAGAGGAVVSSGGTFGGTGGAAAANAGTGGTPAGTGAPAAGTGGSSADGQPAAGGGSAIAAVTCMDMFANTTRNGQPMTDACKSCVCANCEPSSSACYSFSQNATCNAITQCYTSNKVRGTCGSATDGRVGVDGQPQVDCYFSPTDSAGATPTGPCMSEIDSAAGGQQANWDGACLERPMSDNACAASRELGICMSNSCHAVCGWNGGSCESNWC